MSSKGGKDEDKFAMGTIFNWMLAAHFLNRLCNSCTTDTHLRARTHHSVTNQYTNSTKPHSHSTNPHTCPPDQNPCTNIL